MTTLLNAYISWMRRQRGSSTLKSLLYMDEIFGFFPPSKNPPSKEPMLLLLKQARAFGTGVVLSTQNPVDIDYKGLSNIGTWFIGKLQTKQDISKVLDGISAKSDLSKSEIAHKIATLKGRHFFLKNVHAETTDEFYTRWVLSYLKGPMTKDDIRLLMSSKKEETPKIQTKKEKKTLSNSNSKPIISNAIKEYFSDTNEESSSIFYPSLYGEISLRYFSQKRSIDMSQNLFYKLELDERDEEIDFADAYEEELSIKNTKVDSQAMFSSLPHSLLNARTLKKFEKNLSDLIYFSKRLELFTCKALKLESKLEDTKRDFIVDVENALKEKREEQSEKIKEKFQTKYERLEDKLKALEIRLQKEESDVNTKTTDTIVSVGLAIFGAFFGRKSSAVSKGATALRKGQSIFKEKGDVKNIESKISNIDEDIHELQEELENELLKIEEEFVLENYPIESLFIKPRRSDVLIKDFALLWER